MRRTSSIRRRRPPLQAWRRPLASYKVPEARYFTTVFCRRCSSQMPRVSRERGIAIVPMGSLDDDPGIRAQRNIFVGSKAPWYDITDGLPQDVEAPPPQ